MKRALIVLLVFLFVLSFSITVYAEVIEQGRMKIFAVTTTGEGLSAELNLTIEPGDGTVWSTVRPLVGTTTQDAERLAVEVAENYSTEANNYDYKFHISSAASVVDGPSAGAAMALLAISMLKGKQLPYNVSVTGTITKEGFVGQVGGVLNKAEAASEEGIELFMIPKGTAKQTVKEDGRIQSINLVEYAPREFGITVVEVRDIDEVLQYAFSNIEDIDVNKDLDEELPDFIPDKINYGGQLQPMKEITRKYLDKAGRGLSEAKNSLSATLIDDSSLIAEMLQILNDAENLLEQGEILYSQNYLYTSANNAFLAVVNSSLVKDLAANPSLLKLNSSALELKVEELDADIRSLRKELASKVYVDYLEYYLAAQQRLTYASNNVDELITMETIMVGGTKADEAVAAIEDLMKYEYAAAWYEVAADFYEICKDSAKKAKPDNEFEEYYEEFIVQAENGLAVLNEDQREPIERRLNAALTEQSIDWHMAAALDSISAVALANGELVVGDLDLNQLYELLENKIAELDDNFSSSGHSFVWAQLYFDHAKNYLEEADYYYDLGRGAATVSSLKSGISLAYLAEFIFLVMEDVYTYYDNLPASSYLVDGQPPQPPPQPPPKDELLFYVIIILALIGFCIILAFLLIHKILHIRRYQYHYSIPDEIKTVRKRIQNADSLLMKGKITRGEHDAIVAVYKDELFGLRGLKKEKSEHLLILDSLKIDREAYKQKLLDLKKRYSQGIVPKAEYDSLLQKYKQKVAEIDKQIKDEKLELTVEKAKLISIVDGSKKKTRALKSKKKPPTKKQKTAKTKPGTANKTKANSK